MATVETEKIRLRKHDADAWIAALRSRQGIVEDEARSVAERILKQVEQDGDTAVISLLREIDGVEFGPDDIVVRPDGGSIETKLERAAEIAIARVEAYHELQRPAPAATLGGVTAESIALERVGIYVPGGAAVYLSTLVMCAVPARVAGVHELVVATTPRVAAMPEFRWACRRLGVSEIVQAGGAVGIAALALGTESCRPVQKIVGPGNAFVNEAKKLVRDRVGIDLPAGPSEIVVICDESADPILVAADMLAQCEHGPDSVAICLTTSAEIANRVEDAISRRLGDGTDVARQALAAFGGVIVTGSLDEAVSIVEDIAPEHLSIQVSDPEPLIARIRNCAAIFVGSAAGVALGDYVAGSNHVLPTSGAARFCSSLGVADFMKRRSVIRTDRDTLASIGPAAVEIAEFEGLPRHAESVRLRLADRGSAIERVGERGDRPRSVGQWGESAFISESIRAMTPYTLEPRVAGDKLDQNESPFDVPESIKRRAIERMLARPWNQYPEFQAVAVRDAFAAHAGVSRENVLVGNGSNELLMVTMATLVRAGTRVVIPSPTFPLYEKLATIFGGNVTPVRVDPRSGRLPVEEMLRAISASEVPTVVIVCSPNNPTGGVLEEGDLDLLLSAGAFVILDRAYGEFHDSGAPRPQERLVTLSTLSKAWGLASLRVGWLTSMAETCRELQKVKLPYNLNVFSEEVAIAMLSERELVACRVRETIAERERIARGLGELPEIEPFPSRANFVTFQVGRAARRVFERLFDRDILVRNVSGYPGLDGCLRVSIGSPEQNDRFMNALRDVLEEGEDR